MIVRTLNQLPEPGGPHLCRNAWRGALGIFLLLFLSTLPVAPPVRVGRRRPGCKADPNLIALAMLFMTGYFLGRTISYHPTLVGLATVVFGSVLVLGTIALGG